MWGKIKMRKICGDYYILNKNQVTSFVFFLLNVLAEYLADTRNTSFNLNLF